jgi:hypothetical protein
MARDATAVAGPRSLSRNSEAMRLSSGFSTAPSRESLYSITSSARASSMGGTFMPSAFAVLRLITSSNLVDCAIGKSAGFSPLRTLPTRIPCWPYVSAIA